MVVFHIAAVILTGAFVLYSDEQAFLWVLGKKRALSPRLIDTLHIIVSVGLATVITTGGLLFIKAPTYYLADPVFRTKMILVGALIINGFFIDRLSVSATERPFSEHTSRERMPLMVSGMVSIAGWIGAGICGLILA